jgi:hypothetical protein
MFDELPPGPASLGRADDAAVVAAIEEWARLEAAVSARRLFFPDWHVATGDPPEKPTAAATSDRDVMMPTRRRTRAQARASRIKAERARNEADAADRSAPF